MSSFTTLGGSTSGGSLARALCTARSTSTEIRSGLAAVVNCTVTDEIPAIEYEVRPLLSIFGSPAIASSIGLGLSRALILSLSKAVILSLSKDPFRNLHGQVRYGALLGVDKPCGRPNAVGRVDEDVHAVLDGLELLFGKHGQQLARLG